MEVHKLIKSSHDLYVRNSFLFILFSYAFVISFFVDSNSRNYLTIFAAIFGGLLFFVLRLKFGLQALFAAFIFILMMVNALVGGADEFISFGLTSIYAIGYLAISSLLIKIPNKRNIVMYAMTMVIYAFAIISIIQFIASTIGLPIPNYILSKGYLSYNSLAFEPSHIARIVGISMISLLVLVITGDNHQRTKVSPIIFFAFFITMYLSGSTTAQLAILFVFGFFIFQQSKFIFSIFVLTSIMLSVFLFTNPLNFLDSNSFLETGSSGSIRFAAAFIYMRDFTIMDLEFWFGYGYQGLNDFFLYKIPAAGDDLFVGFMPGYLVVYGLLIFLLFLWVFLFSQFNKTTLPLIIFFIIFFLWSAWNTQVFWYGLITIKITSLAALSSIRQGVERS